MSLTKTPFYKTNTFYSITINPDNNHQGNLKQGAHGRMVQVKTLLWDVFNKYPEIYHILHLDISEPTSIRPSYPRIHFHGVILFRTNIAIRLWLVEVLYKLKNWCNIDIDTISDIKIWESYCKKYDHITNIPPLNNKLNWTTKSENID